MKKHPFLVQQQIDALVVFWNKGACRHEGCKKKAHRAWKIIQPLLTNPEITAIVIARDHALNQNESRGEFDGVMKKLFLRMQIDQKGKCCESPT